MALALNNLKRVDMPLNKENKPNQSFHLAQSNCFDPWRALEDIGCQNYSSFVHPLEDEFSPLDSNHLALYKMHSNNKLLTSAERLRIYSVPPLQRSKHLIMRSVLDMA